MGREREHPVRKSAIKAGAVMDECSSRSSIVYESIHGEDYWTPISWGYHSTVCVKCGYGDMVNELLLCMERPETSAAAAPLVRRFAEALQREDYAAASEVVSEAGRVLHIIKR